MKCYCYLQILTFVFELVQVIKSDQVVFRNDDGRHEMGDNCTIIYNKYIKSIGKCTFISDCTLIKLDLKNNIFNHTVCGYIGFDQIVCCPDHEVLQLEPLPSPIEFLPIIKGPDDDATIIQSPLRVDPTDFSAGFDCILNASGEKGVLKFIDDCPESNELTQQKAVCEYDVCKDLVCCPVKRMHKLKPKCSFVDDPRDEIRTRLHLNLPCTVHGTKQLGRFQPVCDAVPLNETMDSSQFACDNDVCRHWYCCPITKPADNFYCIRPDSLDLTTVNFIGPKCTDSKTGKPGTCRLPDDCPGFHNDFDVCGAHCCTALYCCPDLDYSSASKSEQMCQNYQGSSYNEIVPIELPTPANAPIICSGINKPIAGGSPTIPGEYPHMAALGYIPDGDIIYWNCGGSLISDKYVLTAAHCLSPSTYSTVKLVRLGVILLNEFKRIDDCPEDYNVSQVIPHPDYNSKMTYNDIGLILLDREVKFNFHIRPICLPSSPEIPPFMLGMGWGLVGPVGEKSEILIRVFLEQYSYRECNESYRYDVNRRFPDGIREDIQMCVGSRDSIGSTCSGDSGGPLLTIHKILPRMHTIYGITSFGKMCGFTNTPGVYTKVYPYLKWIDSLVWLD